MSAEAAAFGARLTARLCAERLGAPDTIGVFAERMPSLDQQAFVRELSPLVNEPVRVAILGGRSWAGELPANIELTTDVTRANVWRQDDQARAGRRCVTLVVGPAAKINSLRSSSTIVRASDLRRAAVREAIDALPTQEREAFWSALASDPQISDTAVLELSAAVHALQPRGPAVILELEPQRLNLLGLLPEPALLNTKGVAAARQAVARNRQLVGRIRRLSDKDRRFVLAVVHEPALGDALKVEAAALLEFARDGDPAILGRLTYANVVQILRDRPQAPAPNDGHPGVDEDHEPEAPEAPDRLYGDEIAIDVLLDGDEDDLLSIAERYDAAVEVGNDEDVADEVRAGGREFERRLRSGQSALEAPLSQLVSKDSWGGIVTVSGAVDVLGALKSMDSDDAQVTVFRPEDEGHALQLIQRAVARGRAGHEILEKWDTYRIAREALLPRLAVLADHPLMALAADAELEGAARRLVEAHAGLLEEVKALATSLTTSGSEPTAKRLLARALCLDVLVVRFGGDVAALAAPTHPFHLWRWLEFLKLIGESREELREIGETMLQSLIVDPPPLGPNLLLSTFITELNLQNDLVLVGGGSIGALPVFSNPQARSAGPYCVDALRPVVLSLLRVAGHAKFGLRVVLVDPPSVPAVVEDFAKAAGKAGLPVPLHIEVQYTRAPGTASDEDYAQMETLLSSLRDDGGSLRVQSEPTTPRGMVQALEANPAHLIVVFEPGQGKLHPVGVTLPPALSPFVVPRVYRYDEMEDRFTVVIAADASTFGPYYDLFRQAMSLPPDQFFGRHSGSSALRDDLARLAKCALWTVIVDQGVEPTFHLPGTTRLDWKSSGGRDVVTFTAYSKTIEDFAAAVVERAGLIPGDATVARTLQGMRRLGGDTVLMPNAGSNGSVVDLRVAKGLIGALAAARAIEAQHLGALVVSLDDPRSRRWILGAVADDNTRGDLLWIKATDDGIEVCAVEVKTREDADGTVPRKNGRATGRAVEQVDASIAILRRVLSPDPIAPLDRARREILRDQLYRAIASGAVEEDERARAVLVLQQLFAQGARRISGAIFKVKIVSGVTADPLGQCEELETEGENDLVVCALTETEVPGDESPLDEGFEFEPPPSQEAGPKTLSPGRPEAARPVSVARPRDDVTEVQPPSRSATDANNVASLASPGVLLGATVAGGRDVYWDPSSREKPLMNFGVLVTGDPGTGKTQTIRALIDGAARSELPVCIFDFKNDYADANFSRPLGLRVYDVNRDGLPFNPLALVGDEHGEVQPIRQVHEVGSILRRIFGLGDQQEARLKRGMSTAYENAGIAPRVRHNVGDLPAAPSLDEVVEILEHEDGNEALLNRLSPLFDLELFPSSRAAASRFEDVLNDKIVLDLHSLPDDRIKAALAELMIVRLHGHLVRGAQPRALRRLLVFDEAWRVKDSKRLEELAREGRAFGVGIVIGTQYPRDVPEALSGSLETQIFLYNREAEHQRTIVRALCGSTTGPQANQLLSQVSSLQKHMAFVKNSQNSPYSLVQLLPHYMRP